MKRLHRLAFRKRDRPEFLDVRDTRRHLDVVPVYMDGTRASNDPSDCLDESIALKDTESRAS
jgi:hypothetical protein